MPLLDSRHEDEDSPFSSITIPQMAGVIEWLVKKAGIVSLTETHIQCKACPMPSSEHPLGTTLDKLVHQRSQITQHEATHVEAKKLGCVPNAELQPNVRWRGMLQPRILDLASYLI